MGHGIYVISTHTSLAGRDRRENCHRLMNRNFYSHVPRGT